MLHPIVGLDNPMGDGQSLLNIEGSLESKRWKGLVTVVGRPPAVDMAGGFPAVAGGGGDG
jgi:hypothetical protein